MCAERNRLLKTWADTASEKAHVAFCLANAVKQASHQEFNRLMVELEWLDLRSQAAYAALSRHRLEHGC